MCAASYIGLRSGIIPFLSSPKNSSKDSFELPGSYSSHQRLKGSTAALRSCAISFMLSITCFRYGANSSQEFSRFALCQAVSACAISFACACARAGETDFSLSCSLISTLSWAFCVGFNTALGQESRCSKSFVSREHNNSCRFFSIMPRTSLLTSAAPSGSIAIPSPTISAFAYRNAKSLSSSSLSAWMSSLGLVSAAFISHVFRRSCLGVSAPMPVPACLAVSAF